MPQGEAEEKECQSEVLRRPCAFVLEQEKHTGEQEAMEESDGPEVIGGGDYKDRIGGEEKRACDGRPAANGAVQDREEQPNGHRTDE